MCLDWWEERGVGEKGGGREGGGWGSCLERSGSTELVMKLGGKKLGRLYMFTDDLKLWPLGLVPSWTLPLGPN